MASLENCFVAYDVSEPVQLVEVGTALSANAPGPNQPAAFSRQARFSTLQEVNAHFDNVQNDVYTCRYMYVEFYVGRHARAAWSGFD